MDAKGYLEVAIEEFGGKPEDWVQHPRGGGWVARTAHVDDTARIEPGAIVAEQAKVFHWAQILDLARVFGEAEIRDSAKVLDKAQVYDKAQIYDRARVYGKAQIYDRAQVFDKAHVCGEAEVYGEAGITDMARVLGHIRGYAWVSGNAEICQGVQIHTQMVVRGGKWEQTPLYIAGSRYDVAHCAPKYMRIGCKTLPIRDWLIIGKSIAEKNKFTPQEIAEYARYTRLVAEADMRLFGSSYDLSTLEGE